MDMIIKIGGYLFIVYASGIAITFGIVFVSEWMFDFPKDNKNPLNQLKMYLVVLITGIIFIRLSFGGISTFIED